MTTLGRLAIAEVCTYLEADSSATVEEAVTEKGDDIELGMSDESLRRRLGMMKVGKWRYSR